MSGGLRTMKSPCNTKHCSGHSFEEIGLDHHDISDVAEIDMQNAYSNPRETMRAGVLSIIQAAFISSSSPA